jgi:hypothetical protein
MLTTCTCGETWRLKEPKDFKTKKAYREALDNFMLDMDDHTTRRCINAKRSKK